ncbi:TraR/DksA family transcriptional regulator [Cupriavidus sp. AU9028]|uniref:TraR/DksA family transcriptional regulator n=1 Tax=Cupriavidus sp. AU9028 TaxID=2871157 RepID=UPI001C940BAD|nr:TraR/DksA family transcriptional regulator [Cupriavidus sp. AU9028]MBY4898565.1 TraR/DksA family transcriptional regulator [Cupriavidus sp. AU9028]
MDALSPEELRDIEQRLDRLEADLTGRLPGLNQEAPAPGEVQTREVGDEGDRAEWNNEKSGHGALLAHYRGQLHDIDAARERIRSGSFGICVDCEEPIPLARLQAYPVAERCAPCQERHERLYMSRRPEIDES